MTYSELAAKTKTPLVFDFTVKLAAKAYKNDQLELAAHFANEAFQMIRDSHNPSTLQPSAVAFPTGAIEREVHIA